jgi:hypothetical protein
MDIGSVQGWLERANTAGWGWFAEQPGADPDRAKALQQEQTQKKLRIAGIWADFLESPDGAEAMQFMIDQTLNRSLVPSVSYGLTLEQTALYAQFREGQNNIVQSILATAAVARSPENKPKPRDVP